MLNQLLIVFAFLAAAVIIYFSIDKLLDPLLPFTRKKKVKKAVIVLANDSRISPKKTDGRHSKPPISKNRTRSVGGGDLSDTPSLPMGV